MNPTIYCVLAWMTVILCHDVWSVQSLFTDLPPSLQRQTKPPAPSTRLYANYNPFDGANKPILVVGATGQVGRKVVQQLLEQNKTVRALVRNRSKAEALFVDDVIRTQIAMAIIIKDWNYLL